MQCTPLQAHHHSLPNNRHTSAQSFTMIKTFLFTTTETTRPTNYISNLEGARGRWESAGLVTWDVRKSARTAGFLSTKNRTVRVRNKGLLEMGRAARDVLVYGQTNIRSE